MSWASRWVCVMGPRVGSAMLSRTRKPGFVEHARVQIGVGSLGVVEVDHEVEAAGVGQWAVRSGAQPHEVAVQVEQSALHSVGCTLGVGS
jgi:hypothetical protein